MGKADTAKQDGGGVIQAGASAPEFELKDQAGKPRRLSDYAGRWVVLFFYPRDNTPGCTAEACDFRDQEQSLSDRGAVVLGISPDSEASHGKFAEKFSLAFPLLADEGSVVCGAYGVWRERSMYGRRYMGVVRTTYLIDPRGRVAHRWDKVKVKGHVAEVLSKLDALRG